MTGITMRDDEAAGDFGPLVFHTEGAEETGSFGAALASCLEAGDFIAVDGELASGKTRLIQGLGAGLGFHGQVTSPTFSILHLYESGRLPLYHFDLYRLAKPEELEGLGYEDYFYGDGVCAVEWSNLAAAYLPDRRIGLTMESFESAEETAVSSQDSSRRRIIVRIYGIDKKRSQEIVTCLKPFASCEK